MPVAALAVMEAASSEVAYSLSPSQVSKFLDCQAAWWYRYGLNLPDPQTGNQALGSAGHEALAWNFEEKMETGKDQAVQDVVEQFDVEWENVLAKCELRDDESPAQLQKQGRELIAKFMREKASEIQPAAVEVEVAGRIGGVWVAGVVDLVEMNGRIRDFKFAQRKTSSVSARQRFQLATYVQLIDQARASEDIPEPSGLIQIDSLIRTKDPQIEQLPHQVTQSDVTVTRKVYPLAQESMRAGLFLPNRGSTFCSRRNCSFWRACEKEYGGEVL